MQQAFEQFRSAIMQLNPGVTDAEWTYFQSGFVLQERKPKDYFIEAGKRHHHLGFVTSGLIRGYYVNDSGEDITTVFVKENEWATDYSALLSGQASRYAFQCLEQTVLVTVSYAHIVAGYEQFTGFERNGRRIAETVLVQQQRRIESFQFDPAEKRYLDFITACPDLFNRISLTHLSSYLGIERPSLSRIRGKMAASS